MKVVDDLRLGVDGQQQIKRPWLYRVVYALRTASQGIAQSLRRVQYVGLSHQRRHLAVQVLLLFGDLLHVVAFAPGRLVTIDVIKTYAIARCSERSGHGLQSTWPNRRNYCTRFAPSPSQRGSSMRHLDLVAEVVYLCHASLGVNAKHLAEVCRTVAENGEILADALLEQAQHQRLGEGDVELLRQCAGGHCLPQTAGMCDGIGTRFQPV